MIQRPIIQFAKRYIVAGIATLLIASIGIQRLGTAQAEKLGYIQADCPALVQNAIDTVAQACTISGRDKLCYGNSTIQAVFQPDAGNPTFQKSGDQVDVSLIKQFTLGGMDTAAKSWGVAEMKIKADLPDTDPNKAVTFIMFGSVQLSGAEADANATAVAQTATASASKPPTPTGTSLPPHSAAQTAVPLTPVASSGPFQGLQAFYFHSNDTAPCEQAPHDGVLIQSPQGGQRVTLSIDGATVSLGSTVYATAQPSKFLTIYTLEGSARVTVAGQGQTAGAGSAVQVPLDANLRASGPPQLIPFYTADAVRALPVRILPTQITPVVGLSVSATLAQWQIIWEFDRNTCTPDISYCHDYHKGQQSTYVITLAIDPNNIWWNGSGIMAVFSSTGANTYQFPFENGVFTIHMLSPTHGEGTDVYTNLSYQFTETIPFQIDRLDSLTATP